MKNFLKKIGVLSLAVILVFSMSACSKKRSAKEILSASQKKTNALNSMEMNGKIDVKISGISSSAATTNMTIDMNSKVANIKKDNMTMEMTMKMSILGQTMEIPVYYSDGYYYMNVAGQKTKQAMDLAAMKKQIESSSGQMGISADAYKQLKLSEKDGKNVLSYTLDQKSINSYLEQIFSQMSSMGGSTASSSAAALDQFNISDVTGTITVDDNDYIENQTMKMTMTSKQNSKQKMDMNMNITYKNPGKDVKVSLPSDLSSYKEAQTNTNSGTTAATTAAGN